MQRPVYSRRPSSAMARVVASGAIPLAMLFTALPATTSLEAQQPQFDDGERTEGPVNPTVPMLDFPGGTFAELLERIGEQIDLSLINLVLKRDAAAMPVEPMRLRDVTMGSILELIIPRSGNHTQRGENGELKEWYVSLETITPPSESWPPARPIYIVRYHTIEARATPEFVVPRSYRLVSLAEMSEDEQRGPLAVEVFLDLVETLVTLSGTDLPDLDYHEPSGMLIAHVTDAQSALLIDAYESFMIDERRRVERLRDLRQQLQAVRLATRSESEVLASLKAQLVRQEEDLELFDRGELDQRRRFINRPGLEMNITKTQQTIRNAEQRLQDAVARSEALETQVEMLSPAANDESFPFEDE